MLKLKTIYFHLTLWMSVVTFRLVSILNLNHIQYIDNMLNVELHTYIFL